VFSSLLSSSQEPWSERVDTWPFSLSEGIDVEEKELDVGERGDSFRFGGGGCEGLLAGSENRVKGSLCITRY
jgi:hypothetical protein